MQTSVSKQIVEKWLERLSASIVEPTTIESLRELAAKDELQNPLSLQKLIAAIEASYAEDPKDNS